MQMKFSLNTHGGKREGAGRKRRRSKGVSHECRERVSSRTPLHVNFKFRISVRNKETLKLLKRAIKNSRRHGLKVLHYSFQKNHVHLIVEASENSTLTKGMRSLTITFAKGINQGRIQVERYHLHILKTFLEVKNAVRYVEFNEQKHDSGICSTVNSYSSLLCLKDWQILVQKFASLKKMTLKIERGEVWRPDESRSYVYKKGVALLYHDHTSFS